MVRSVRVRCASAHRLFFTGDSSMKIQGAKKIHYESGPNMTPLVDITMVILIFLMLTGSFVGSEHFLASNMPISRGGVGGVAPPPGFIPDEPIEIRVDTRPGGRFWAGRESTRLDT